MPLELILTNYPRIVVKDHTRTRGPDVKHKREREREKKKKVKTEFLDIWNSISFLLLVVRPGTPSSVLAPSSDALCY